MGWRGCPKILILLNISTSSRDNSSLCARQASSPIELIGGPRGSPARMKATSAREKTPLLRQMDSRPRDSGIDAVGEVDEVRFPHRREPGLTCRRFAKP